MRRLDGCACFRISIDLSGADYDAVELGSAPDGASSSHQATGFRSLPPGGFVSVILPFFSERWLREERGPADRIVNFTLHRATRSNGKMPRFFCVRLSWNGDHVHQLCDPNEKVGGSRGQLRTSGVVRAAVEEFWNDMKRAHWVDAATRSVTITLPVAANNAGVRMRIDFHIEFTAAGTVLPSTNVLSRVERTDKLADTRSYLGMSASLTCLFVLLEMAELLDNGLAAYFGNMWNVIDWLNFVAFFISWATLSRYLEQTESRECVSDFCQRIGYHDDWEIMSTAPSAKGALSVCVTIQLLKLIKFASALVPKMGLAPEVLKKALPDLLFFVIVFILTLLAFSQLFYVQLGPFMVEYVDQRASFVSLGRALFGDFDIGRIFTSSPGYIMVIAFLIFLFVTVFIMLSMFFAILGESQANLRDDQRDDRKEAEKKGEEVPPEYGVLSTIGQLGRKVIALLFPARTTPAGAERRAGQRHGRVHAT